MGESRLWWWLGRRHVAQHQLRTLITALGVASGVAMLVAVQVLDAGLLDSLEGMVRQMTGGAQLVVGGPGNGVDESLRDRVAAVPGVAHAAVVLERVVSTVDITDQVQLLGVDLVGDAQFLRLRGQDGDGGDVLEDPLAFLNTRGAALVSRKLAEAHRLQVGGTLTVAVPGGNRALRVYGILAAEGLGDGFGGAVAVMSLEGAQEVLGCPGRVSRILVATEPTADVAGVLAQVRKQVAQDAPVQRAEELVGVGESATAIFRRGLWLSSLIALLVAMGIIYNTVLISSAQRRRELAILRCLGASRLQVFSLLCSEAAGVGLAGSVLGVVLGFLLARVGMAGAAHAVSSLYLPVRASAAALDAGTAVTGLVLGMTAAVAAAAVPARVAVRVAPVEGAHPGVADEPLQEARVLPRLLAVAGLTGVGLLIVQPDGNAEYLTARGAVAAAAAFLAMVLITAPALQAVHGVLTRLPLSLVPRLALDNMVRSMTRGSANVAALAASVLTVVALAAYVESFSVSMRAWLTRAVNADLVVLSTADLASADQGEMDGHWAEDVAAVPGVRAVEVMRTVQQTHGPTVIRLRALNLATYLGRADAVVVAGHMSAERLTDPQHPRVVISEAMAHVHGLTLGDALVLSAPAGPQAFTVDGIVVDYSSPGGVVVMDRSFYLRGWRDPRVTALHVVLQPGVAPDVARRSVLEVFPLDARPAVMLRAEYQHRIDETLDGFFALSRLLVLVALVVGILGIINTLQASVLDRRREMALLRACGARRGQVASMVVLESVLLASCATVLGTAGGVLAGNTMVMALTQAETGWHLQLALPWMTMAFTAAACVVVSALAALHPARQVTSRRVTDEMAEWG